MHHPIESPVALRESCNSSLHRARQVTLPLQVQMTARDSAANDLLHLVTPTDVQVTLPEPAESGFRCNGEPLPDADTGRDAQGLTAAEQGHRPIPSPAGLPVSRAAQAARQSGPQDKAGRDALLARYRHVPNDLEARLFIHQARIGLWAGRCNRRPMALMHPWRNSDA